MWILIYFEDGTRLGGWSGRVSPDYDLPVITSTTNGMYVTIGTDPIGSGRGFKMELTAITSK